MCWHADVQHYRLISELYSFQKVWERRILDCKDTMASITTGSACNRTSLVHPWSWVAWQSTVLSLSPIRVTNCPSGNTEKTC